MSRCGDFPAQTGLNPYLGGLTPSLRYQKEEQASQVTENPGIWRNAQHGQDREDHRSRHRRLDREEERIGKARRRTNERQAHRAFFRRMIKTTNKALPAAITISSVDICLLLQVPPTNEQVPSQTFYPKSGLAILRNLA